MIPTSRLPRVGEYVLADVESPAGGLPSSHGSVLYQQLMDSLDQSDRDHVLAAIARHADEVREAESAGERVSEALR